MLLHLALTGWISTQRDWHQDDYLNPPFVANWYAAVWMALDDISAESGRSSTCRDRTAGGCCAGRRYAPS